jgi:hypothetical protein
MKGKTRDELFIIRAYESAMLLGDLEATLDKYEVGRLAGLTAKGVDAITVLLAQANFIKKLGPKEFHLTKNGETLALRLLSE